MQSPLIKEANLLTKEASQAISAVSLLTNVVNQPGARNPAGAILHHPHLPAVVVAVVLEAEAAQGADADKRELLG